MFEHDAWLDGQVRKGTECKFGERVSDDEYVLETSYDDGYIAEETLTEKELRKFYDSIEEYKADGLNCFKVYHLVEEYENGYVVDSYADYKSIYYESYE